MCRLECRPKDLQQQGSCSLRGRFDRNAGHACCVKAPSLLPKVLSLSASCRAVAMSQQLPYKLCTLLKHSEHTELPPDVTWQ